MSDVNANINISINSQQALGQLRALQNQISTFNQSIVAGNVAAAQAQRDMTRNLTAQINATKGFTTSISNVETSVSRLSTAIDKNKLSLREYFRYGVAASGAMGKGMREHADIMQLAGERVKRLQTNYIALEKAHNGYTRSLAVRPTHLFNADSAIAIQRQQIFNKLLGDGSTALVNWGKNTQWAGRQLMVGFTVPLTIFGGIAGKIFMDLEKQVVQFKRVYGDLQTPQSERNAMVEEVKALAKEFTKYGIAVSDTVALAAKAAATGAQGEDLMAATTEATRLATLGQIDYQQALDATISLQTALGISSDELADATNFLNAVENQTVTSLDDITSAIPLVAPVVKGLGGDVKDLAIFMTAMREGGISANEGANALKSGLASLINPTRGAKEQLEKVGINIDSILSKNKGDLRGLVSEFGEALGTLGKFERQQTLAKMFGKYQFARMGALFSNISKEGSQAARVIDLTAMSTKELGQIAEGELGQLEESVGVKFTAAVEKLKLAIAPIGEAFLKIATPIIDFASKIADAFNNLPDAAKTFITWGTAIGGVLIPTVIMLVGLLGNFAGNMLKIGAAIGRLLGKTTGLSSGLEYLTMEELDAMAASASLEGQTNTLTSALNVQRTAVKRLTSAYGNYVSAAGSAAANLPQGFAGRPAAKMARGGMVGGTGNKDSEPALLMPGEFVINAEASKKFAPLLAAINNGEYGMYKRGRDPFNIGLPDGGSRQVNLDIDFAQSAWAAMERRLQNAANQGIGVLDAVISELSSLTNGVVSRIETVDDRLRSAGMSDVLPSSARAGGGVRYSYPGGETPTDQMQGIGMSQSDIEREVRAATISGEGARNAIIEQRDLLASIGDNFEETSIEAGYARSHAVEVDKTTRDLSNWTADKWELQSQLENNLITTLKGSQRSLDGVVGHLQTANVSQERIDSLLDKINRNVALTEQDFDTLAIGLRGVVAEAERVAATGDVAQIAALRGSKGNEKYSPALHRQAIGALGAYEARRGDEGALYSDRIDRGRAETDAAEVGAASGEAFEESMVSSAGDVVERIINDPRNSPHPAVPTAAKQDGTKYGTDFTQSAIAAMKKAGQDTGSALTPRGVAEDIKREKEARIEAAKRKAAEVAINKAIEKRAMILQGMGLTAQAARARAKQEIVDAQQQLVVEEKILDTKQKQEATEGAGGAGRGSGGATGGTSGSGENAPVIEKEGGPAKKGLRRFAGKLIGASFALDGLIFGMSMMEGGVGEFAQQIMPAVFGMQALAGIAPMLMNPVGGLIAGLAASAGAIWYFKSKADEMSATAQKFADSMISTQDTIDKIGEFYGKQSIASRQSANIIKEETGVKNADVEKAREFVQSEVGQSMQEGLSLAITKVGTGPAAKQFSANLGSMVLQGVMSPKQAQAVAMTMGEALGNQQFGIDVNGNLKTLLGPKNENLLKRPLKLAIEVNQQNARAVESLTMNVSDLSGQIEGFNEWKIGDAVAASINPVYGLVNAINKATLGWDNWVGQVSRSARGILNPDDFENVEASLKSIGSLAGNQMAQAYDNLSAAKARYKDISEKAAKIDEKDVEAKKKAERAAKIAERDLKSLTRQIKQQQSEISTMFSGAANQAKVSILEGMRESISKQFENDPAMKLAWDMINGQMKDVSQNVQFNINMGISSGILNPIAIQSLMGMFSNPTEASATINFLIQTQGLGTTNQMILDILNIKDETIRKEAIVNLILKTPNGLDQNTLNLLDPNREISGTLSDGGIAAKRQQSIAATEAANKAQAAWDDRQTTQDPDLEMKIRGLKEVQQSIYDVSQASDDYAQKEEHLAVLRAEEKRLTDEITAANKDSADQLDELNRLKQEAADAEREYAVASEEAGGATQARWRERQQEISAALAPLQTEFLSLKDLIQEISGQELTINYQGMDEKELTRVNGILEKLSKLPPKMLKTIDVNAATAIENAKVFELKWKNIDSFADIDKKLGVKDYYSKAFEEFGIKYDEFAKLPDIYKKAVLVQVDALLTAKINLEATVSNTGSSIRARTEASDQLGQVTKELANLMKSVKGFASGIGGDTGSDTSGTGGSSSGGGGDKTQPLKDLWKSMIEQIKLYGNVNASMKMLNGKVSEFLKLFKTNKGIADELAAAGYSPQFIEQILGLGSQAAKKFAKLGVAKGGGMTQYGKRRQRTSVLADIQPEIQNLQNQRTYQSITKPLAMGVLNNDKYGLTDEMVKSFGDDEGIVNRIASLKSLGKQGLPILEKYLRLLKQTYETTADPMQEALDELNKAHDELVEKIDEEIKGYQEQIDAINDQIEAKQRLNDADQETIDGLNRQKEMIQRQIEALERANELDQRKIDSLQRQDELRQRVADALQRELEIMSRTEQQIRDTYQKRIDALDRVAQINDHILQTQRSQLSIAQALTEGDVYAAAAAAQEMQREDAQFASDQTRKNLEANMESQIANLTTASGLTRAQVEAQIQAIQDQSYQTQLQIRDIQDRIYQRNLDMIPLKDQQYKLDLSIQEVQDRIYERGLQIDALERDIQPLQDRIDAQEKIKDALTDQLEEQIKQLEAAKDNLKAMDEQIAAADALAKQWAKVQNMIAAANSTAKNNLENKVNAPERAKYDSDKSWREAISKWKADIEKTRQEAIAAAQATVKKYAGGMIKKFGVGSVVGEGSRDSVPAMLTPGEYVIRKAMVDKYGLPMLENINQGSFSMPKYSNFKVQEATISGNGGGTDARTSSPVYNTSYSINVNARTNASPDEIANVVMNKISSIESMSVRGYRGN